MPVVRQGTACFLPSLSSDRYSRVGKGERRGGSDCRDVDHSRNYDFRRSEIFPVTGFSETILGFRRDRFSQPVIFYNPEPRMSGDSA
jgi:hypothetical protein